MDERLRFVARLLEGEKMAGLCREFDISRKTGYKIFQRYKDLGLDGLTDRSRRPYRHANKLPVQVETLIVQLRREHPSWGAPKIREKLRRRHDDVHTPAISTVHAVLARHGLVQHGRKRRPKAQGTRLSKPLQPNDLWCADYKGEFMLADRRYCYPLTITDFASRYLLGCEALDTTKAMYAFPVFQRVFTQFGLPKAIRTDNGVPFASPHALFGLSKLAVWWLRLGIEIERIRPGCPQQNGRHERMHLTLKKEATKPAAQNLLQQQARFDDSSTATTTSDRIRRSTCATQASSMQRRYGRTGTWRTHVPVARSHGHRNPLRPHLHGPAQDQPELGPGRPECRRETGGRPHLAGQLHAVRLGFLRRRDMSPRAGREPVRGESVTHVSGINRHLCDRNTPLIFWRARQDSNPRPPGS